MNLNELRPAEGSKRERRRIGRGHGSGWGKTAGKGHNGQKQRSGTYVSPAFEGGQMPLQRRIPKRGFKNFMRVEFRTINLSELQHYADKESLTAFDFETFRTLKLIKKSDKIKVLGNGELTVALNVTAHAFSEKAKEAIEAKGGSTNLI